MYWSITLSLVLISAAEPLAHGDELDADLLAVRVMLVALRDATTEDVRPASGGYALLPSLDVRDRDDLGADLAHRAKPIACTAKAIERKVAVSCASLKPEEIEKQLRVGQADAAFYAGMVEGSPV